MGWQHFLIAGVAGIIGALVIVAVITRVVSPLYLIWRSWWRRRRYDHVSRFVENIAIAGQGEERFHIGRDGFPLYPERYFAAFPFQDGKGIGVTKEGDSFLIFPDGSREKMARHD